MALVLVDSILSQPDENLCQALRDYESLLSEEDKRKLRAETVPDVTAVIKFTASIDEDCNNHRRQCVGQRLMTFLDSVQQFSAVVDTFVSSHPEIAALVWGGVKITLLVRNICCHLMALTESSRLQITSRPISTSYHHCS